MLYPRSFNPWLMNPRLLNLGFGEPKVVESIIHSTRASSPGSTMNLPAIGLLAPVIAALRSAVQCSAVHNENTVQCTTLLLILTCLKVSVT